ncbi:MAG: hypothetical protein JKY96_01855 [Phycisphaerales bacterium]|nr:hypothetical protein [Phycisphaerales bacterium]
MNEEEPTNQPTNDEALVVLYLKGRDVPCPSCGYNRRGGASATCPECSEIIKLMSTGSSILAMYRSRALTMTHLLMICITADLLLDLLLLSYYLYYVISTPASGMNTYLAWSATMVITGLVVLALINRRRKFIKADTPMTKLRFALPIIIPIGILYTLKTGFYIVSIFFL